MANKISLTCVAVMMAVISLAGCQGVKEQLGVGRNSPDEFTVVKRAPLTLPPDYNLRVPSTGSAPPSAIASNQAKTIVLGNTNDTATVGTAEEQLLKKMGADHARSDIRDVISEENGFIALDNRKAIDKIMFWSDKEPSDANIPVSKIDSKKEAERLKKVQEEGAPINSGDVPVVEPKESTIDKIF